MSTESAPAAGPVAIDIVSDVVCPWCFIGKRRLERALAERSDVDVAIRWHPFQLDPTIPAGGLDRRRYMATKFGSAERVDEIHARLLDAGRGEGIAFAFDRITRAVNTLDAHRVLHWAAEAGVQNEAKEALFRAYFMDGQDIGDPAILADIGTSVGLDAAAMREALGTDRDKANVQAEIEAARKIGVSGVPFFIFAQSFAVSGAQAAEVLATAIDRAREHMVKPGAAVLQA